MQHIISTSTRMNTERTALQPRAVASMTDALLAIKNIMAVYGTIVGNISEELQRTNQRIELTRNRLVRVSQESEQAKKNLTRSSPNGFNPSAKAAFNRKLPPRFIALGKRPDHLKEACEKLKPLPNFGALDKFRDCLVTEEKDFSKAYSDPYYFVRQKYESLREQYALENKHRIKRKKRKLQYTEQPLSISAVKRKVKNQFGERVEHKRLQKASEPRRTLQHTEQPASMSSVNRKVQNQFGERAKHKRLQLDSESVPHAPTVTKPIFSAQFEDSKLQEQQSEVESRTIKVQTSAGVLEFTALSSKLEANPREKRDVKHICGTHSIQQQPCITVDSMSFVQAEECSVTVMKHKRKNIFDEIRAGHSLKPAKKYSGNMGPSRGKKFPKSVENDPRRNLRDAIAAGVKLKPIDVQSSRKVGLPFGERFPKQNGKRSAEEILFEKLAKLGAVVRDGPFTSRQSLSADSDDSDWSDSD